MFKGFVISYAIIIGLYASLFYAAAYESGFYFVGIIYLLMLIPLAIYGGWKYRVSPTSWRGIFFSFDGNFREFLGLFIKELLLTLITFGIYGSWMAVKIQKYLFSHTKIGDLRLGFQGDGTKLFGINILGVLLSYITLEIYLPIFIKNKFNFTIGNTSISNGEGQK